MIESLEGLDPNQLLLQKLQLLLHPTLLIVTTVLIGLFIEFVVLTHLSKIAQRTAWGIDDLVLSILQGGITTASFVLAGVYHASLELVETLSLSSQHVQNLRQGTIIILIILLTIAATRLATGVVALQTRAAGGIRSLSIFHLIVRIAFFTIAFVIILYTLHIPITPALAALGAGSLGVSLALQDTMANLFSGVQLTASQRIRPGNYIKLSSGEEGYVVDINWNNTQIRQWDNNMVVVPNSILTTALITNYYNPNRQMIIWVDAGVSYTSDLEQVERVTLEVAREVMDEVEGAVPLKSSVTVPNSVIAQLRKRSFITLLIEDTIANEIIQNVRDNIPITLTLCEEEIHDLEAGIPVAIQVPRRTLAEKKGKTVERKVPVRITWLEQRPPTDQCFTFEVPNHIIVRLKKGSSVSLVLENIINEQLIAKIYDNVPILFVLNEKELGAIQQGIPVKVELPKEEQEDELVFPIVGEKVPLRIKWLGEDEQITSHEPFIRYNTFDDFRINFSVFIYVQEYLSQFVVKHELIKRLHKRYRQEGIDIPFPIRDIYLRDANHKPDLPLPMNRNEHLYE